MKIWVLVKVTRMSDAENPHNRHLMKVVMAPNELQARVHAAAHDEREHMLWHDPGRSACFEFPYPPDPAKGTEGILFTLHADELGRMTNTPPGEIKALIDNAKEAPVNFQMSGYQTLPDGTRV